MTPTQDRQLRIAIFSDSALPILNGVSVSIDSLVKGLRARGHSVHVFTAAHFRFRDPDPHTYRFFAVETPWTKGYPLAIPPFYPMLRHFRRIPFDIVHTHTPWTIGFVGLRWAQSHDVPVVSTYHTLYDKYAHYIPFVPKRYVRYKIAKHTNFYYNQVAHVITPSAASARWLSRHSVKTPTTIIPTGVRSYPSPGRAEARSRLGLHPEERMILYTGRIAAEKNMKTLFEAAALIMQRDPRVRLWLVGDGPARTECVELTRALGIGDRVRFVGFLPRPEVEPYYAAADLFLFCSMTETQGLVISEAMSHGLPAVVVQGGGASAAIDDGVNGFIARNDAQHLAELVANLLDDDGLYLQVSTKARQMARELSVEATTDQVLDVYRDVLGISSPQPVSIR